MTLALPLLTYGQSTIGKEGDLHKMLMTMQGKNRSLFDPDLSYPDSSSPKMKMMLLAGNHYNMKEFSQIAGKLSWGKEHGVMGIMGSAEGLAGLNRTIMKIHYTQQLSSDLYAGIAMGILRMKFNQEADDSKGLIAFKLMQIIQVNTSFGLGISAIRDLRSKSFGTMKSWSSWCSRVINPNIRLGVGIEKEDGFDPLFQIMSQAKVGNNWTIIGGWTLGNGRINLALLKESKKTVHGIHISNHPLLGYGFEFIFQYAKY